MAKPKKLETAYNEWVEARKNDDTKKQFEYKLRLATGSYGWNLLEAYEQTVKLNDNEVLCFNWDYWTERDEEDKILDALDWWKIDEFVFFGNSKELQNDIRLFCDHGWKIDGCRDVRYRLNGKTSPVYPGLLFIRA